MLFTLNQEHTHTPKKIETRPKNPIQCQSSNRKACHIKHLICSNVND